MPEGAQPLQVFYFEAFLQRIGVDSHTDAGSLAMVAAGHMFSAPLPPEWSECYDEDTSSVFYFNRLTGESRWAHPQEDTFRELIREVRCWRPDDSLEHAFARSTAHLESARQELLAQLEGWSGPHEAEVGTEEPGSGALYFCNGATGESSWLDPRLRMEFDLAQRHDVLRECLAERSGELSGAEWSGSEEEEDPLSPCRPSLPATLASELPAPRLGATPRCGSASPCRRPAQLPKALPLRVGDESVRSCASYLSACSDAGCAEDLDPDLDLDIALGTTRLGGA